VPGGRSHSACRPLGRVPLGSQWRRLKTSCPSRLPPLRSYPFGFKGFLASCPDVQTLRRPRASRPYPFRNVGTASLLLERTKLRDHGYAAGVRGIGVTGSSADNSWQP
jgi:hypothetical protein